MLTLTVLLVACAGKGDDRVLLEDSTPVGDSTPGPGDDSTPPDTSPPDPCAEDPAVSVSTAVPTTPWTAHEAQVDVTLTAPAAVAVRCTLAGDAEEVHLVEAAEPSTSASLRLAGLLAGASYRCAAAATCPRSPSPPVTFTIDTARDPAGLPAVTVTDAGGGAEYLLANHADDCTWDQQQLLVFDRAGRVRWLYALPEWVGPSIEFRYHGDDRFAWGGGWGPNALARPRLLDLYDGEIYDAAAAIPDMATALFHHDGKLLEDGRMATLEEVPVEGTRGSFKGFQVRILDPSTDTVEATYHSQRAYDEGHLRGGTDDAWHANWVEVRDRGDHRELYVSLCFAYQTIAVDADSGDWLWDFGDGGDFALVDAEGHTLPDSEFPQCQHGLERVGDNLLVYDNGWERGQSRIAEYTLDTETWVATQLWTWTEPDWYETTLGDADYLPGGDILVTQGHAECFSSNPGDHTGFIELDPVSGEKRWELTFDAVGEMAYRGDWADACALFANGAYCPAVAARAAELAPIFDGG